jgi:Secretion system C-terminal sorting domain
MDKSKRQQQANLNLDGKFYNRSTMFPFKNPVNTADLEECMHKFITSAHDMAGNIASDSIMLYKSYNRPPKPIITVLGVNKATITWQDNYINELAYVLQRKEGNGVWHDLLYLPKQVSTYTDSTLQPNTTYSYRTFAYYVGPKWYGPSVETSFTNVLTGLDYSEGETKISVFPNPANDVLNVQVNDLDLGKQLSLMNAVGIEVLNQKMDKNDFTVSLSNLNAGMYVLKVGEKVQKVIISK